MNIDVYFVDVEYNDAKISFYNFKSTSDVSFEMWHTHIFYELHFSFENTVNFKFKEQTITLNPGELLIIPPSVLHESVDIVSTAKNYKVLSLEVENTNKGEDFYKAFINGLNNYALKPIKIQDINKDAVFSLSNKDLYSSVLGVCELKTYASQIVFALFKKIVKDKKVKPDYNKTKIIIDYMISLPNVSLNDIAEATSYSNRQVARLIKEQYGVNFSEIRQRIKRNEQSTKQQ